jgi:hypothetical protein
MDDLHRFLEPACTVIERITELAILDLVPARADSEDESSTADLVHGFGHLRDQPGIAKPRAAHERAKVDPWHASGYRRHQRPALPDSGQLPIMLHGEVIGKPDHLEANITGQCRNLDEITEPRRLAAHAPLADRDHQTERHLPRRIKPDGR